MDDMRGFLCCLLLVGLPMSVAAAVEEQVRCREVGFSQAAEARDTMAFAAFIDPDARFISNSVARGVDAVVTAWSGFFDPAGPSIKWRPRFVEVLESGGLALSRGPYRVLITDEQGGQSEHWGTFNSVWRLQSDGSWKVVFDAGSPGVTPPPEEDRALLEAEPGRCSAIAGR
jgi:ketosteroid isomerase-like protein